MVLGRGVGISSALLASSCLGRPFGFGPGSGHVRRLQLENCVCRFGSCQRRGAPSRGLHGMPDGVPYASGPMFGRYAGDRVRPSIDIRGAGCRATTRPGLDTGTTVDTYWHNMYAWRVGMAWLMVPWGWLWVWLRRGRKARGFGDGAPGSGPGGVAAELLRAGLALRRGESRSPKVPGVAWFPKVPLCPVAFFPGRHPVCGPWSHVPRVTAGLASEPAGG